MKFNPSINSDFFASDAIMNFLFALAIQRKDGRLGIISLILLFYPSPLGGHSSPALLFQEIALVLNFYK
jgi:hypothetical protein